MMYLEYVNQGDDESQTAEVKAYVCESNARAWFTNSKMGEQQIGTSKSSFWLTKWGSDNHYMTAKINYYYPTVQAATTTTPIIYITTDAQTGEFSAMLPPLKYKVESIKFEGGHRL